MFVFEFVWVHLRLKISLRMNQSTQYNNTIPPKNQTHPPIPNPIHTNTYLFIWLFISTSLSLTYSLTHTRFITPLHLTSNQLSIKFSHTSFSHSLLSSLYYPFYSILFILSISLTYLFHLSYCILFSSLQPYTRKTNNQPR